MILTSYVRSNTARFKVYCFCVSLYIKTTVFGPKYGLIMGYFLDVSGNMDMGSYAGYGSNMGNSGGRYSGSGGMMSGNSGSGGMMSGSSGSGGIMSGNSGSGGMMTGTSGSGGMTGGNSGSENCFPMCQAGTNSQTNSGTLYHKNILQSNITTHIYIFTTQ